MRTLLIYAINYPRMSQHPPCSIGTLLEHMGHDTELKVAGEVMKAIYHVSPSWIWMRLYALHK